MATDMQIKRATLFDPKTGRREAVQVGSPEAQRYFSQGFLLETPDQNFATIKQGVGIDQRPPVYGPPVPPSLSDAPAAPARSFDTSPAAGAATEPPVASQGITTGDSQAGFREQVMQMLKNAQQGNMVGNEDLLRQRNALIQARFGARTAMTPESLMILSPDQQAALRAGDVSGLETQLSGVDAALKAREAEQAKQDQMAAPIKVGDTLVAKNPETGAYETVFGTQAAGTIDITDLPVMKQLEARDLSTKLFGKIGGIKPENLSLIASLMSSGMTRDQIEDELRHSGQSEKFKGAYRDAAENIALGMGTAASERFFNNIDRNLEDGNYDKVLESMKIASMQSMDVEERKKVKGKDRTVQFLLEIQQDMERLQNKGINTNIFNGTTEAIFKMAGTVHEPELRKLATKIASAVQTYRKDMSGAAFTESEQAEYKAMFPDIEKSFVYNKATSDALLETFVGDLDFAFGETMGPGAYRELYGAGGASVGGREMFGEQEKPIDWTTDPPTEWTDTDIDSFLQGFKGAGSDAQSAQGKLSEMYESGGDPGAIGYDSTGGYSYGAYQLAHNNAKRFIEQSPYSVAFQGLNFNSSAWQETWKDIARRDPDGFKEAQKKYIEQTHYQPQVDKLSKAGIDTSGLSDVMKDVIWSTAVQHGANTDVVVKALKKAGPDATEAEKIKAIYDERWSGGQRFASSSKEVKNAVKNRFFGKRGELNQALSRLS